MTKIKFTKMQAYGNDYVYIDNISQKIDNPSELSIRLSNRHFGIGSDGIVLLCPSDIADFRMRMFNPDGTEGEMCGNALRSVSKFAYYLGYTQKSDITVETLGGIKHVYFTIEKGEVVNITADIGEPCLLSENIPVVTDKKMFANEPIRILDRTFYASSLSWGNPHTVVFIEDTDTFLVEKYGPAIENATDIFPKKTNVTFAQIVDETHIKIREWERGTGETIGCGTGCSTAVVYGNILGKCARKVSVEQIGGVLEIEWKDDNRLFMTGPSHVVYDGVFYLE